MLFPIKTQSFSRNFPLRFAMAECCSIDEFRLLASSTATTLVLECTGVGAIGVEFVGIGVTSSNLQDCLTSASSHILLNCLANSFVRISTSNGTKGIPQSLPPLLSSKIFGPLVIRWGVSVSIDLASAVVLCDDEVFESVPQTLSLSQLSLSKLARTISLAPSPIIKIFAGSEILGLKLGQPS